MKKFVFTLQAVLDVKRALEKQQMAELSVCNARIREFERVLQDNLEREAEQYEQYRQKLETGISPADLQLWRSANLTVRDRVEYQKKVLEQAEDERLRVEKKLVEVMQERKVLEKLREKQWDEYRAGVQKETSVETEEFVSHGIFEQMG